jgi:hypothetical protein
VIFFYFWGIVQELEKIPFFPKKSTLTVYSGIDYIKNDGVKYEVNNLPY